MVGRRAAGRVARWQGKGWGEEALDLELSRPSALSERGRFDIEVRCLASLNVQRCCDGLRDAAAPTRWLRFLGFLFSIHIFLSPFP